MVAPLDPSIGPTIPQLLDAQPTPAELAAALERLRSALDPTHPAWICVATPEQLEAQLKQLAELMKRHGRDKLPLYGVPFAVKDNIDVAGFATTAACPAYSYVPTEDATVVARLRAAGAIVIGKTNLDQFATGLVGTRSPYGPVPNSFNEEYISGGSSSGSAFVVARGLVPFSLGTDTAGSGRVPAGFNNIVGLKPTKGRFSTRGVVPACRTLDCVSVFALTVEDAALVADIATGFDAEDPYSRSAPSDVPQRIPEKAKLAIPDSLEFFGDSEAEAVYQRALEQLSELGAELVPVDFAPFRELALLLYEGPWVAERTLAAQELLEKDPEAVHPVVRGIIQKGTNFSAMQAFAYEYKRAELARKILNTLSTLHALVVPTTPTIYKTSEVLADPVATNSRLGTYTNFTNLADLSALAVPAGFRADGLPAGITLLSLAFHDAALVDLATRYQAKLDLTLGATGKALPEKRSVSVESADSTVLVAVVGAHLTGLPLNHELTERGAVLVERTKTAANYRLYALTGSVPLKPGLARDKEGGSIELEVWRMPIAHFGSFVRGVPAPLGIGNVELHDGRTVKSFICEPFALEGAEEITHFGGFKAYLASKK